MIPRRAMLALALAACETDPSGNDYLFGFGDPLRGAALYAPQNLGDTSRWQGRPDGAALAAAQLETLADGLETNPRYAPEVDAGTLNALRLARAEMRGFLGIRPDAAPELVINALRRVAELLRAGQRAGAEAVLSNPIFTAGPLVTLARLNAMPRLPRTAEAAGAAAAEFDRLDRPSRRR